MNYAKLISFVLFLYLHNDIKQTIRDERWNRFFKKEMCIKKVDIQWYIYRFNKIS